MLVSLVCLSPFAAGALIGADDDNDSLFKQLSVLSEVLTLIQRTYVDEVSIRQLLDGALEGTTDGLDSLSTFVPAEHVDAYSQGLEVGSAHSGIALAKDRGIAYAVAVEKESPAAAAGVMTGDVIAAVNGGSTRNMELWRLQTLLADAAGTELDLELLRGGQSRSAHLVLGPFERCGASLEREEAIPLLEIPRFDEAAVGEVRDLLAGLADSGDDRLIVDLRGVAGGDSEAAYRIAALLTSGRLGIMSRRDRELKSFSNDLPPLWQGAVALLVDGGTQGAAEILTAVLKQSVDATLIGSSTFGLAGQQGRIDLPSGGLVVTMEALFTGPDGRPIDERLQPDEPVRRSFGVVAESEDGPEDRALRRAVEILSRSQRKVA